MHQSMLYLEFVCKSCKISIFHGHIYPKSLGELNVQVVYSLIKNLHVFVGIFRVLVMDSIVLVSTPKFNKFNVVGWRLVLRVSFHVRRSPTRF
jgi:hypothetical protein